MKPTIGTIAVPVQTPESLPPLRTYGGLQLVLAAALLANSVLGPLVLEVVSYPVSQSLMNQLIGLELVTAFLVVPWAALAGLAALRGNPSAPILGFAPAAYAAYMLVQYVLGPEYAEYSLVALAHLALFVLSAALVLWSWSLSRQAQFPPLGSRQLRTASVILVGLAVFVLLRYAGAVTGAFSGADLSDELMEERTFFWSIFLLDLGLVVPCTLAAAMALRLDPALGQRALYAVVGWFSLVPPSVAAMALVMWVRNDPHASLPTTVMFGVAALAFGAFAWHTLRPLLPPETSSVTERNAS